ncbi:MAG: hypothetical protein H6508_08810 [Calditrichaeota bacterium]|nr:hypothetical protein [Calditrichota bacterium]
MSNRFENSASAALAFLSDLLHQAGQDSGRVAAPHLLEMLTLCRETGLRLPVLETYSRVNDLPPAVTLIGGDANLAHDLARCFGLEARLPAVPDTPMIWWIESGTSERTFVQPGDSERELSDNALQTFLSAPLPPDRVTVLKREVPSQFVWRFAWLTDPEALALLAAWPAVMEAMLSAHVIVNIGDDVNPAFAPWFARPGVIARQFTGTEIVRDDVRPRLLSELCAMREHTYADQQAVLAATWKFILPRLVDELDARRQQYALDIDRQNIKLQTTRQMLSEYRRNWSNTIRNIVEDYFTKKESGPAFAALLDPRQPGPQAATYVQALSLNTLWKKLNEAMTDKMAEFVQGLSALATRIELRSISLKEIEVRWVPTSLGGTIEEELNNKQVFSAGGGERSGLVGSLIGKKDEITGQRKSQILRANKVALSLIDQDFVLWSDRVLHTVEQRVRVQLTAAQVNQGLPDIEMLRAGLTGIDHLTAMLEGNKQGAQVEPPKRTAAVLAGWAKRRWFRRYAPAV